MSVLHHDDRAGAERMYRQHQAADHVVGHPPAGVPQHVRLPEPKAEHCQRVDAGVHARKEGQTALGQCVFRPWAAGQDVALVTLQQPVELGHGRCVKPSPQAMQAEATNVALASPARALGLL